MVRTVKISIKEFKSNHYHYNAGYITYYKIIMKILELEKGINLNLSFIEKTKMYFSILMQFIFKPMLWVFHTKTQYDIRYKEMNGELSEVFRSEKYKTFYFLRIIPFFFYYTSKLNKSDWEYIKK